MPGDQNRDGLLWLHVISLEVSRNVKKRRIDLWLFTRYSRGAGRHSVMLKLDVC